MANPPTGFWNPGDTDVRGFSELNMNSALIQRGTAATKPSGADLQGEGVVYYETDTGLLKRYNGTVWEYVSSVTLYGVHASRPTGENGMAYFSTNQDGGTLYLYRDGAWTKAGLAAAEPAAGDLSGTYPNPSVASSHSGTAHHTESHASRHEPTGADVMAVDAAAAIGSLRTLGTGALQAATGSHSH